MKQYFVGLFAVILVLPVCAFYRPSSKKPHLADTIVQVSLIQDVAHLRRRDLL